MSKTKIMKWLLTVLPPLLILSPIINLPNPTEWGWDRQDFFPESSKV